MANDRWYNPGDNYLLDDLSGFKIRASRSRRIPGGQTGGLQVAPERWETQQPQDFVRGVPDNQQPSILRPRQQNVFMVVASFVTAASARGATVITLDSTVGMTNGDRLQIMLDSGVNFTTTIAGINGAVVALAAPLPFSVGGNLGDPLENTVLDLSAPSRALNWPVI